MSVIALLLPPVTAAATSWLLTPLAARVARAVGALDDPGPRKVHHAAVPRLGGVSVLASVAVGWVLMSRVVPGNTALYAPQQIVAIGMALVPVVVVSLIDDIRPLGPGIKGVVQVLGAVIAVFSGVHFGPTVHLFGGTIPLGIFAVPASVVWIVGVTNAFNLADGLDGLSTGLGLISAISLAAIAVFAAGFDPVAALPAAVVAGALTGFLPFNLYPAKVFLGDVGSAGIGFTLGCLAVSGAGARLSSGLAVLIPLLAMGVPVAETLVSITRRLLRGRTAGSRGVFRADNDHFHHRLLAMGFDHRRATFTLWLAGVGMAMTGLLSLFITARSSALLLFTLLVAAFVGVQRLGYEEFAVVRRGILLRFYDSPVLRINFFRVFVDVAAAALSFYAAVALKSDRWPITGSELLFGELLPLLALSTIGVFSFFRLYRRSWRAASVEDLVQASLAVIVASTVGFTAGALLHLPGVTPGLYGIYTLAMLAVITGMRSSFRILQHWRARGTLKGTPVLIYGGGAAGQMAAGVMLANQSFGFEPVGFIDDNVRLHGRYVQGFPILGSFEQLGTILNQLPVRRVIVASRHIERSKLDDTIRVCGRAGIDVSCFRVSFEEVTFRDAVIARRRAR